MPLNDTRLRSLKPAPKPVKLSDGGGLYIHISTTGAKLWRMSYRFAGRQKTLSFGSYPSISLSVARKRRDQAKELIAAGVDPGVQVKVEKQERLSAARNTFGVIADELLEKAEREGRAEGTVGKKRWLLDMAKASFGTRPIRDITAADILVPLRKVEREGNLETAKRLRAAIGQVFRYAISTARAEVDPTYGLRGAIAAPVVKHRAALTQADDFARLLRAVWAYEGAPETRIALKLLALLYPRPGELRQAKWAEFDLDQGVWTIPALRAKMRREHRKPLPAEAVSLLKELQAFTGYRELAFYSTQSPGKPMSENTLNGALRRMGVSAEEATAHGFRASASSLLNESGLWSADAIEAELAHIGGGQVRRVYHRALYWSERVKMAAWWAAKITSVVATKSPSLIENVGLGQSSLGMALDSGPSLTLCDS